MPESLSNFATRVSNLSRIPSGVITDAQLEQAIEAAISRYSKDLPLEAVAAIMPNSTDVYTLTDIVAGWTEGHQVIALDYEFSNGDREPIDDSHWQVYQLASVDTLRIRRSYPGGQVYMTYTYPHTLTYNTSTIRELDRDPLAALAASYCLQMYASETSDASSSTMVGDAVDYSSIPDKLDSRRRTLLQEWIDHVQRHSDGGVFGEWDIKGAFGSMFYHGGTRF